MTAVRQMLARFDVMDAQNAQQAPPAGRRPQTRQKTAEELQEKEEPKVDTQSSSSSGEDEDTLKSADILQDIRRHCSPSTTTDPVPSSSQVTTARPSTPAPWLKASPNRQISTSQPNEKTGLPSPSSVWDELDDLKRRGSSPDNPFMPLTPALSSDEPKSTTVVAQKLEKSSGKRKARADVSAEHKMLLGPFEKQLNRPTREEMRAEALALEREQGDLGPLDKMNIWLKRSTLMKRPSWMQLEEANASIHAMRNESLDPAQVKLRQDQEDEAARQREKRRMANKVRYGLLQNTQMEE